MLGKVSIHATLAGGDDGAAIKELVAALVSIHATLAGGDSGGNANNWTGDAFLSTPPSRVATACTAAVRHTR